METVTRKAPGTSWYNAVWRWHFYAGLFCLPFILWLSVTGTIYLWKPQIEAWQERAYDSLPITATRATPEQIVATALAAQPGAHLSKYERPETPAQAVRVLIARDGVETRVYVDPYRSRVLGSVREDARLMKTISALHGTLLAGKPGSWLVEIAACWTITMLLTGLYLWWPRGRKGLAGVLYPRWRSGRRLFWRDTHAVAGIWVSLAAVFLIATGLPWANAWGSYLAAVRTATGTTDGPVDWMIAGKPAARSGAKPAESSGANADEHAGHRGMAMPPPSAVSTTPRPGDLDRMVAVAERLPLAAPVLIAPKPGTANWTIGSESANRPQRTRLTLDGTTGQILDRRDFAQRQWIDRAIGYGIAIHEGAFFGLANQILGTLVTTLLATLAISGTVMWWRRRKPGTLGAPLKLTRPRYGAVLIGSIATLAVAMPMFGATLLTVLAIDRLRPR
ncbi:PepSY-associated TM helix domain-containing protein [Sphingomonas faeni]|uniref:PepSY-associated TM helix domain-containing protein n=1 Tax=Sphingomonas faeni TaxID=185950 RepID=UPI0020C75417|nr:PepSY domain-containing protein [Sphingomonas faeni]MCP8889106.1 PepSY domain-containing protein [Sphingomonas faeni]